MIAYIKGTTLTKSEETLIIENNGLGYEIFIPKSTLIKYSIGHETELFLYHHITDNGQTLFGFNNNNDRQLFLQLISVSGVGPKTALQFFDTYSSEEIVGHITSGNLVAISKINGIGKKSSERIVLELKEKLTKIYGPAKQTANNTSSITPLSSLLESAFKDDIINAFLSLGYNQRQVEELINKNMEHLSTQKSVEDSIKYLLTRS